MKMFTILFVLAAWSRIGLLMPTTSPMTPGQTPSGPCQWGSNVTAQGLNDTIEQFGIVHTRALRAFNSTCQELGFGNQCRYLSKMASGVDSFPTFDTQVLATCDVQEVTRQAFNVTQVLFHLIRGFCDRLENRTRFKDLFVLKNRLSYAVELLSDVIGEGVTTEATIGHSTETIEDITLANANGVMVVARVPLEVDKILTAFNHVFNHTSNFGQ